MRRPLRITLVSLGILGILLAIAWVIAPRLLPDPMLALREQLPVRVITDRDGAILQIQRQYDLQWREPVPLDKISPFFLKAVVAVEDNRFYSHHGFDLSAFLRALYDNITHGRICSGASTLSMQLVALPNAGRRKNIRQKFLQILQARQLERLYPKETILAEYVNRLPYGGKFYGVQAASLHYFGKNASELTQAEATLLVGIPQKPNRFRPDKFPETAKTRQKRVLDALVRHGVLSVQEAQNIVSEPVYLRDFSLPSYYTQHARLGKDGLALATIFSPRLPKKGVRTILEESDNRLRTTLDFTAQGILQEQLRQQISQLPGVQDGAAVLLDTQTGDLLACVGTIDWSAANGQVNAIYAWRQAGSTLKPFLYEEAIRGGYLTTLTTILDAPLRYGQWRPENYDGSWSGWVTATRALSTSLNAPAVRLLQQLGTERFEARLLELGIPQRQKNTGLTAILGTGGYRLMDLTIAYADLARRATQNPSPEASAVLTARMLRDAPAPEAIYDIAWKTGTSNGNHDAWCFAFTPEYTIGVWLGNKSGVPATALVGATAAAPVAIRILTALTNAPPDWEVPPGILVNVPLCKKSGLSPSSHCKEIITGEALPGFRLPECELCQFANVPALKILSPMPGTYEGEPVALHLTANRPVRWFVNQLPLPENTNNHVFSWGKYTLHALAEDGSITSIQFTVR